MTRRTASVAASLALLFAAHAARAVLPIEICRACLVIAGITPGSFSVTPTSLDFGNVPAGTTAAIDVVITNLTSSTLSPNFSGGAPLDAQNFGGSQNCAGKTFAPGESCAFTYEFTPSSVGVFESSTTIGVDTRNFPITLSGVGFDASTLSFSHELSGAAKLKGDGFKARSPYSLELSLDVAALTFVAMDSSGTFLAGRLAPMGKKGRKFRLLLDETSADSLANTMAAQSAAASGLAAGAPIGNSSKLTLKLRKNGKAALRIKSEVFTSSMGAVSFAAKLKGGAIEQQ